MSDRRATLGTGAVIGGKYRLDRLLGEGGMGAVYAAENLQLRAPVAIKVLHPELSLLPNILGRFEQEAQAAAQVRHANVVSVLDFGRDEESGALFLVQEFLVGDDLKHRLRERGAMGPREALSLLLPLMRALSFAHSKGVVHRDIKPDNIFLCETPDGVTPKLIDFGIAKVFGPDGQSVQKTRTSQTLGTPLYMSPEQARGDATVDHRTDVWSLGVVLYNMLTLRHPYEGASANEIIGRILFQPPVRIETWRPELSPDVVALVHGAIQPDLALRLPSMDAFAAAARACSAMEGADSLAREPTVLVGASLAPSRTPPPTTTPPRENTDAPRVTTAPDPPRRGVSRALIAALVVALPVVIVTVLLSLRGPETAATQPPPPTPDTALTQHVVEDAAAPDRPPTEPSDRPPVEPPAALASPDVPPVIEREPPRVRARAEQRPRTRDAATPATPATPTPPPPAQGPTVTPNLEY